MSSSLSERAKKLGSLGISLIPFLNKQDLIFFNTKPQPFQQWLYANKICSFDNIRAIACSMLLCKYPFQISISDSTIIKLLHGTFLKNMNATSVDYLKYIKDNHLVKNDLDGELKGCKVFPHKKSADSKNKLNMYFSEVWACVRQYYPKVADDCVKHSHLFTGMYNDQATACIIYACILYGRFNNSTFFACLLVRYPDRAKDISCVIKSCGANNTRLGALLCECNTLTGRGVGEVSLIDEATYRCDDRVHDKVVPVDQLKLAAAVKRILQTEVKELPEYESLDQFWSKRWLWCVNGSHSQVFRQLHPEFSKIEVRQQLHRRVFSEDTVHEPVSGWDGRSAFSSSLKLEHGKLRALFAGDSLNYFAFEHFLRPIEKSWIGRRVVLDPGKGGVVGMVDRIMRMQKSRSINLMVDYDDFNSQHTLESMATVVRVTAEYVGYPADLAETLVASLFNQHVFVDGKDVGTMLGTLCSGHRGTTFFNSILNAAYVACSTSDFWNIVSLHVGDDVYLACESVDQAITILDDIAGAGFRINPLKQSVGSRCAEFLRTAIADTCAYGYAARSVASAISGNWLTQHKQDPIEFLRTMAQHGWTLINRTGDVRIALLLQASVCRTTRLSKDIIANVLLGKVAVGQGPIRGRTNIYRWYEIGVAVKRLATKEYLSSLRELPAHATTDYLSSHVTPVESLALTYVSTDVKSALLDSSYSKTLASSDIDVDTTQKLNVREFKRPAVGSVVVNQCYSSDTALIGELNKYPILHLIKNAMSSECIRECLHLLGIPPGPSPAVTAWGADAYGTVIDGALPFSDASALGSRTIANVVATHINIFM